MSPKPWGWWTKHKLQILEEYLHAFTTAASSVPERIYLDLFAGWPENRERDSGAEILGSIHRALTATPPFTRICAFELEPKAAELAAELRRRYPHSSEIKVYAGDCNRNVERALADLAKVRWAPTFAFVDQFDHEVQWSTLEQIARFRPESLTKAEIWILFGTSFYPRGLGVQQESMNASYGDMLTEMLGSEEWVPIIQARRDGRLAPAEMRFELVNVMRWRLEHVLGYRASHVFTMKNTNGQDLYDMIFTSDHPAGDRIMRHLYGRAMTEHEEMRRHAAIRRRDKRQRELGVDALFDVEPEMVAVDETAASLVYQHEPPQPPYGLR